MFKRNVLKAFAFSVMTLFLGKVQAATYYIDAVNGNDTKAGTSTTTAWKTLTKINTRTFVAGDKILLKAGSTWTGQKLKFLGSGSSTARIIVNWYGTGAKPILAGNGLIGEGVVYLYNQSNIEINNL